MKNQILRTLACVSVLMMTGGFLTGCLNDIARPLVSALEADSRFDGTWTGWVRFSIGEDECPRRATLRAKVIGGRLEAQVRWTKNPSLFNGIIREGALREASFDRAGSAFAEVEGSFSERQAKGTWVSKLCRGTWTMQKIRNS